MNCAGIEEIKGQSWTYNEWCERYMIRLWRPQPNSRTQSPRRTKLFRLLILAFVGAAFAPAVQAQEKRPSASDRFVLCDDYCALVDGNGARVTDRLFEHLNDFQDRPVAIYRRGEKSGAIDRAGRTIVRPIHDYLSVLAGRFLVAEDKSAGSPVTTLFDEHGTELLRIEGDARFGAWGDHVYYSALCTGSQGVRSPDCRTVFLDDQGKGIAGFRAFSEDSSAPLTAATLDGEHMASSTGHCASWPRHAI
jgi:hypothetical protein